MRLAEPVEFVAELVDEGEYPADTVTAAADEFGVVRGGVFGRPVDEDSAVGVDQRGEPRPVRVVVGVVGRPRCGGDVGQQVAEAREVRHRRQSPPLLFPPPEQPPRLCDPLSSVAHGAGGEPAGGLLAASSQPAMLSTKPGVDGWRGG